MRVDRERFLFLVAAIAASCSPSTPPVADPFVTIPAASTATPVAAPVPTEPPSMPIASAAPTSESRTGPTEEEDRGASDDGACRAKKSVSRPSDAACNDDRGTPGDCKAVKLAGGCRSFQFICDQCEAYKRYFKPKVAERAVACVVAQSRTQLRDGCRTYECGDEALKSACIDSSVDATCASIASKCNVRVDECRELLSGMNAAGRAKIAKCAAAGCQFGLWSCVEGL
jgi:hypothetical protein